MTIMESLKIKCSGGKILPNLRSQENSDPVVWNDKTSANNRDLECGTMKSGKLENAQIEVMYCD